MKATEGASKHLHFLDLALRTHMLEVIHLRQEEAVHGLIKRR